MQKAFERGDFGEAIEQLALVDGVVRRAEAFFFDGFEEPGALGGVLDVGDLVAGRGAVDPLQLPRGVQRAGAGACEASAGERAAHHAGGQSSEVFLAQTVRGVRQVWVAWWLRA